MRTRALRVALSWLQAGGFEQYSVRLLKIDCHLTIWLAVVPLEPAALSFSA
jgi:hypothetical protein